MKHFLPSSVMLVPFVVKHYPDSDTESQSESEQNSSCDLCDDPTTNPQLKLSTENQVKAKKGRKLK